MNVNSTDFIDDLGVLALGSRLKRLSDRLLADAASVYQRANIEIEPRWFPLLALLDKETKMSASLASQRLGVSQPAISQFVAELKSKKLIVVKPDENDSRKRIFSLSDLGLLRVQQMKELWPSVRIAAQQLCDESSADFYQSILNFEKAILNKSLTERTISHLENCKIELLEYHPSLDGAFREITEQWVSKMFVIESSDRKLIDNPKSEIIDKGGYILFAKIPRLGVVGTCALIKTTKGEFELTKMGVLESARGQGIGDFLMRKSIDKAREVSAKRIFLLSNKRCEAAIHLYHKYGFNHDDQIRGRFAEKYDRCDVCMSKLLG